MINFTVAKGSLFHLPSESSPLHIPCHGESLDDRFTIIWGTGNGGVFGSDYKWGDEDWLTAWGHGGWYSVDETDEPDPFEPGNKTIAAVFWTSK